MSVSGRTVSIGIALSALGTLSNPLGTQVLLLTRSFNITQTYYDATIVVQFLGLLIASIGSVMFACWAGTKKVALWGLSTATIGVLTVEVLNVGILTKTAIFIPVFYAAELTASLMLLIAGLRFAKRVYSLYGPTER
jgi:uncharacterized membrane protein